MPKKICTTLMFVLALAGLLILSPGGTDIAHADSSCPPTAYPCEITNFFDFLISGGCPGQPFYFNPDPDGIVCRIVKKFNFAEEWNVMALATESALQNTVEGTLSVIEGGGPLRFDTYDTCNPINNWGTSREIVLTDPPGTENLTFTTAGDPATAVNLDPYCPSGADGNCDRFRVCKLTQDSDQLDWFTHLLPADQPILSAGTYIIGFDDNPDFDYDDVIIAAWPKKKPQVVTPSTSEDCLNLGTYENEQGEYVPVTMSIKKKSDCTVEVVDIFFFANNPECKVDCLDDEGQPILGCVLLDQRQATPDPDQNYCMALEGSDCNECLKNNEGSPQEYWYWNNGQLTYSCFDLAVGFPYQCPDNCYDNVGCHN